MLIAIFLFSFKLSFLCHLHVTKVTAVIMVVMPVSFCMSRVVCVRITLAKDKNP